jgi:hypothetical protein
MLPPDREAGGVLRIEKDPIFFALSLSHLLSRPSSVPPYSNESIWRISEGRRGSLACCISLV